MWLCRDQYCDWCTEGNSSGNQMSSPQDAAGGASVSDGLVTAEVVVSGEESSSSTYGTVVQDGIVMCPVPSDSSDSESCTADDPQRRLVRRPRSTDNSVTDERSTT